MPEPTRRVWALEQRLAWIKDQIERAGSVTSRQIHQEFWVTDRQARIDLATAQERWPGLIVRKGGTARRSVR